MKYLVDANVLSESAKVSPQSRVVEWLATHRRDFVMDSIVLSEMYFGVLLMPAGRKRRAMEDWVDQIAQTVECLPWDAPVALRWAQLMVTLRRRGQAVPFTDAMIAATALTHGLTVATRNVRDFEKTGVQVVNPFV